VKMKTPSAPEVGPELQNLGDRGCSLMPSPALLSTVSPLPDAALLSIYLQGVGVRLLRPGVQLVHAAPRHVRRAHASATRRQQLARLPRAGV
jgi:hypothetical protein